MTVNDGHVRILVERDLAPTGSGSVPCSAPLSFSSRLLPRHRCVHTLSLSFINLPTPCSQCHTTFPPLSITTITHTVFYNMDKAASVVAAFQAGKQPSQTQINAWVDYLLQSQLIQVEKTESGGELSENGRRLAGDARKVLDAYKAYASSKNSASSFLLFILHVFRFLACWSLCMLYKTEVYLLSCLSIRSLVKCMSWSNGPSHRLYGWIYAVIPNIYSYLCLFAVL